MRVSREPWPLVLAALLASMIGTSVGFWRGAARHPDPLVVDDADAAARRYSERVRAARRAESLGWSIDLVARPNATGAVLRVALRDGEGQPLAAERVTVRRERPAEGGLDAEVALEAGSEGWSGGIALPRPGRWRLVVRAERDDEVAERSFALFAP
jgi:nitrogen fixation protein FixH